MMKLLNSIALFIIGVYQKTLSPDKWIFSPWLKGTICAHEPHCSEYSKQCYQKYWFADATVYSFDRITSCTPSPMIKHDPSTYSVVFFSGSPIGVPFLTSLHDDPRFSIQWVVTMPDMARDRGQKLKQNIIKSTALELWIDTSAIHNPPSLRIRSKKHSEQAKVTTQRLTDLHPDFIVVIAYGNLLPKDILDIPHFGSINVHGSLLPEYRWASPLQSVFLDNKKETGITIMHMDEGMDTGDMISKLKTDLPLHWTVKDLIEWIQSSWPTFLNQSLWEYGKGDIKAVAQDDAKQSHCKKIDKQEGQIDPWNDTLQEIYQKHQWYALWPKIFFDIEHGDKSKRVIIESISLDETIYENSKDQPMIDNNTENSLNPSIIDLRIKVEWKKASNWESFRTTYLTK